MKNFYKNIARFTSFICCIMTACMFVSCSKVKPWEYDNVIWYSDTPFIEITRRDGGDWIGVCFLEEEKEIELLWGGNFSFLICPKDTETISENTILLQGKIKYDKKTVTLLVDKDNLYGNEYEEIVLNRRDLS